MHLMHNLRNPWSTAYTKRRARQSDRPLKSCHIDHLLWNRGASLIFVMGTRTDPFSRENDQCSLHDRLRSVMCTDETYRGSYRTCRADMCTRLCMVMHMCRQTQSISGHAYMHKTDLPIAPNKRYTRYLIDVISLTSMRRDSSGELFSIAAHRLKFLSTLHKNRSHVHNSGTELRVTNHPNLLAPIAHPTRYSAVAKPSKVAKLSHVTFSQYI
jgi:hypothetical protein